MMKCLLILIFSLFATSNSFNIHPKIVDGDLSNPQDFPFYVQIIDTDEGVCGGTILSERWIVTAAHCIFDEEFVVIFFGIQSNGSFKARMFVPLEDEYIYTYYDEITHIHDIALIKLPQPIAFNEFIQPAKLANDCNMPHSRGKSVTAVGMGRIEVNTWLPIPERRLRQAYFTTMSSGECSKYAFSKTDPETFICARANANGQRISVGDSGGPVLLNDDGLFVGVISAGVNRPRSAILWFQIFTYVPYYFDWIERETGLNLPKCKESREDDLS